jgi:hypothetical protein
MRRFARLFIVFFICIGGAIGGAQPRPASATTSLEVLFIGNSFTYFNNLGDVLAGIAASLPSGPAIHPTLLVGGGMTLQWHYATGKPAAALKSQHWDYVVLQEQSALGGGSEGGESRLSPPSIFHQSVRKLVPDIRAVKATPLLLMTWARREHAEEQALLTDAYLSIARELNVQVAPSGLAWQEARTRWPELSLHVEDGSHPNPAGTYLTACVLYAAITGRDPHGAAATIAGHPYSRREGLVDLTQTVPLVALSDELSRQLQDVAWSVARASLPAAGTQRQYNLRARWHGPFSQSQRTDLHS